MHAMKTLLTLSALFSAALAQSPQQLLRQGKLPEALALYQDELKKAPNSAPATIGAGVTLDLMGRTAEAKKYFAKAIETAPDPPAKANAQRAMAMSYAFDGDCANTVKYNKMVFDHYVATGDFYQQGEMANEAARVCIDNGKFDEAEKWYRIGTEVGLKEPNIRPQRVNLWNFRLEHALARLAARRGNKPEALKHVAAAKAILDKDPEMATQQAIFYPYLIGYVALYTGDPKTAIQELKKANQNDPFIQCLMAEAYQKLGDQVQAQELHNKASGTTAHNPPGAYAHLARRK